MLLIEISRTLGPGNQAGRPVDDRSGNDEEMYSFPSSGNEIVWLMAEAGAGDSTVVTLVFVKPYLSTLSL